MHRRSFITMLAMTPLLASRQDLLPSLLEIHEERRFRPARSSEASFAWIQVEVHLALTERAARGLRNREAHDPFDGLRGEFYISDTTRHDIPGDVPGTVITYETVVGVAAVRSFVHVGGFRRGKYVWVVRLSGGSPDLVLDIADVITAYDLPDEGDVRRDPVLLRSLLPGPEDLPVEVEIDDEPRL